MFKVGDKGTSPWCMLPEKGSLTVTGINNQELIRDTRNTTNFVKQGTEYTELVSQGRKIKNNGSRTTKWPWVLGTAMRDVWAQDEMWAGQVDRCGSNFGCREIAASYLNVLNGGRRIALAGLRDEDVPRSKVVMRHANEMVSHSDMVSAVETDIAQTLTCSLS